LPPRALGTLFLKLKPKKTPPTHLVQLEALIFDLHAEVIHELCHILLVFLVSPHKFLGVGEWGVDVRLWIPKTSMHKGCTCPTYKALHTPDPEIG